ncbi:ABC transporter ATP-binding protein [Acetivibrio cellulolyticus]|uniref:ABC transporter ATP-binding protein n=1 Tax=Acetivibrio cellulolyticus TaxID=35830 RepID=UPI0001E2E710|nr:ATP-binding cassette domain-containing protein [Acetivibrio cellulolyticus]
MSIIKVDSLCRTFNYYEKEVGLVDSLKNLFYRKNLVKDAVKNISFQIEQGEVVGFLGPNGAGKTTTLKMLSGILYPSSGSAVVMGYVPWERKAEFKKSFSIVMGQKSQLWWDLPANESFNLNKHIYGLEDKAFNNIVTELSELLDVRDLLKVQVRRLSLGERMKMELIASLVHNPKVMFLDEPTIGLDIVSQKKIREFLKYYNVQNKTTIILTSHYMKDIEDLCQRSIIINSGKIVFDGELSNVNEVFSHKKIVKLRLEKLVDKAVIDAFGKIIAFEGRDVTLEVDKQELKQKFQMILEKLPVLDFNIEDVPIEEGIALLYKGGGQENERIDEV